MSEATTIGQAIGHGARRRREELGLTQDEVARQARRLGLPWSRPAISSIEQGDRDLSLGELAIVAAILETDLPSLLSGAGRVVIAPDATIDVNSLAAGLAGERQLSQMLRRRGRIVEASASAVAVARATADPTVIVGEAEQKAAAKLGVDTAAVATAAVGLWGRSLTAERDVRVARAADPTTAPRRLQALRGHVTRSLVKEIRESGRLPRKRPKRRESK